MKSLTILWLDDDRDPNVYLKKNSASGAFLRTSDFYKKNIFNKYDVDFVWCHNFDEFTDYIEKNGLPEFISFDRDLKKGNKIPKGTDYPDGEDCAKWLKDYCRKNGKKLPKYFVHSANRNGQINIPQILGDKVVEKVVLTFSEFVNEKYDTTIMDEKIKGYVQQINDALTDDALDYIYDNGDDYMLSDGELGKLFSKNFMHKIDCPEGNGLCLVYDENNAEIELFSLRAQMIVWSVKCDIQNVQSIIDATIECLNNCMKEGDLDPYTHNN
jgi:hypothetical protein